MYSRILSLKDYKEVALTIPAFVLDEARLEEEMQRLANPYIQWEEGNTAVAGDIVICDMASENTRFSKKQVKFVVGSGMFQREVEALVEGMKVGEQRETVTEGGSIAVTLRAVKTRYVPPLKDSMVEHLGLEGIYTLRDYRDYLLGVQKKKALDVIRYDLLHTIENAVLRESEFVLYKEDWQLLVQQELDRCRAMSRREGMVLEEMTPEQFQGRIPVKSYAELVIMTQNNCWDSLRRYLLGCYYAQEDDFSVGESDYEEYIRMYCTQWHEEEKAAREIQPYEIFRFNAYCSHAYDVWSRYIEENY